MGIGMNIGSSNMTLTIQNHAIHNMAVQRVCCVVSVLRKGPQGLQIYGPESVRVCEIDS